MRKAPLVFLAAAIVMIGIGVLRGEADTVFSKGINLCLECVGIG
nr:CD1871A family CXXC motif-containing protein [Butyricicoccus pullicaecorum]